MSDIAEDYVPFRNGEIRITGNPLGSKEHNGWKVIRIENDTITEIIVGSHAECKIVASAFVQCDYNVIFA